MEGSAKKIYEAALGIPEHHSIVLLAHNGPTGFKNNLYIQTTSEHTIIYF